MLAWSLSQKTGKNMYNNKDFDDAYNKDPNRDWGNESSGEKSQDLDFSFNGDDNSSTYNSDKLFTTHLSWFSGRIIGLIIFCIFWDGFMITWFTISIMKGIWIMAAFGSIHALVGIVVTYMALQGIFNKTRITITSKHFIVKTGPFPPFKLKNILIDKSDVAQIFPKKELHRSKNGTYYTYGLFLKTLSGDELKIIDGLYDRNSILNIELEVENFLGIQDTHVQGEMTDKTIHKSNKLLSFIIPLIGFSIFIFIAFSFFNIGKSGNPFKTLFSKSKSKASFTEKDIKRFHQPKVYTNYPKLIAILKAHPELTDTLNSKGFTLLHIAAHRGNLKLTKILLENGANITVKSKDGYDAIFYAKKANHNSILKLLNGPPLGKKELQKHDL